MVKVSVIVPCYNSANFIIKTLDSILNQTMREIEIICINDKSTDSTLKELKEIQKKDKRVKVIDNKNNLGPGGSRNAGIRKAKGKYVMFVDSDDWLEKDACEKLYKLCEAEKSDISYIFPRIHYENKIVLDRRSFWKIEIKDREEIFKKNLKRKIGWAPWTKIIKREILTKNKIYFPDIYISEDIVFSTKVLHYSNKISSSKEHLYNYFIREGSLMSEGSNPKRRIENYFESIELIEKFLKERKILEKYKKDFIYLKLYTYLAISGVLYYSKKEVSKEKYSKKIKKDRDFRIWKIISCGKPDSVVIGSLLLRLNLFNTIFFFREKFRSLLNISRM